MTELQNSLDHKENSISQLKSQLEYQCLGVWERLVHLNVEDYSEELLCNFKP